MESRAPICAAAVLSLLVGVSAWQVPGLPESRSSCLKISKRRKRTGFRLCGITKISGANRRAVKPTKYNRRTARTFSR